MAIAEHLRKELEQLVVIYLNALEQHQAGWDAQSVLQTIADHHGAAGDKPARWKASLGLSNRILFLLNGESDSHFIWW